MERNGVIQQCCQIFLESILTGQKGYLSWEDNNTQGGCHSQHILTEAEVEFQDACECRKAKNDDIFILFCVLAHFCVCNLYMTKQT